MANGLTVADNLVVSLDYVLRLENGEVVDSSEGHDPLMFIQGAGGLIPGFAQAVYGLTVGEEKDFMVTPAEGYGELDPAAKQWVARSAFPKGMKLESGMGFQVRGQDGDVKQAFVAEVQNERVLLDYNHPMAGKTLYFHVKVVDLRQATSEELAHGHVHQPGHHHHH